MAKADFRFHMSLRVRWRECDAQGIAFYGSYTDYLEVGQADYYRNLGIGIYKLAERDYFDTAVVKLTLEFRSPARVDDMVDVYVRVSRMGNTSITMETELYAQELDRLYAEGQIVYVGYDAAAGSTRPVPPDIRELVDHYEKSGEVLPLERFPALASATSL